MTKMNKIVNAFLFLDVAIATLCFMGGYNLAGTVSLSTAAQVIATYIIVDEG